MQFFRHNFGAEDEVKVKNKLTITPSQIVVLFSFQRVLILFYQTHKTFELKTKSYSFLNFFFLI